MSIQGLSWSVRCTSVLLNGSGVGVDSDARRKGRVRATIGGVEQLNVTPLDARMALLSWSCTARESTCSCIFLVCGQSFPPLRYVIARQPPTG